jgi:hypothetical protein
MIALGVEAPHLVDELLPARGIGRTTAERLGQEKRGAGPAERVRGTPVDLGVQRDGAFEACDGATEITGAQGGHAVARELIAPTVLSLGPGDHFPEQVRDASSGEQRELGSRKRARRLHVCVVARRGERDDPRQLARRLIGGAQLGGAECDALGRVDSPPDGVGVVCLVGVAGLDQDRERTFGVQEC